MLIAIDYDKTWTEDPVLWRIFAELAQGRGHSMVMVTGRKAWSDDMLRGQIPSGIPIVYSDGMMKERAARLEGYSVGVWIDDMPGTIQPVALLDIEAKL